MNKRKLRNGDVVSRLGMGLMRLPEKNGAIDYNAAEQMIDTLMEKGVTYYDTAYVYHGGNSEAFASKALISRHPRDKFTIATKMPLGEVEKIGGVEVTFNSQIRKLGTDYIDYYLMHGIDYGGWELALRLGAIKFAEKMKDEGKIRNIGFSFHGATSDFPKVLDAYDWDFVQIQLNYYDWYAGGAKQLYDAAVKKGLPVIVMEPVHGGGLTNCHPDIKKIFDATGETPASWALRWVGSLPGVDVILSGMSNMQQVNENISLFSPLKPLEKEDHTVIETVMERFKALPLINCTECKYCAKCPKNISIPALFAGYNDIVRFGSSWYLMNYRQWEKDKLANTCINCGACEEICPQGLKITENLKEIFERYT